MLQTILTPLDVGGAPLVGRGERYVVVRAFVGRGGACFAIFDVEVNARSCWACVAESDPRVF